MKHSETMKPTVTRHAEFPRYLLPILRCSRDAGSLTVAAELRSGSIGLIDATLRCSTCAAEYTIEDGIARMMQVTLTAEDKHEIAIRDEEYVDTFEAPASGWRSEFSDLLEVPPHLSALEPLSGRTVLEFGCGDGRFTLLMAQLGARVLAVDFSLNALLNLAQRLASGEAPTTYRVNRRRQTPDLHACVGLVQADACHFHVAPRTFDRALSATPLDSRDERMAMYRSIAESLTDNGRYVGSLEYDDLTRRLLGLPTGRRYCRGGIFIEHFDIARVRREISPYFLRFSSSLIRPRVPFIRFLPRRSALLISHIATMTPVLRQLCELVLFRAEAPVRPPLEGANRRGSRIVKTLFQWYVRKLGKTPSWQDEKVV